MDVLPRIAAQILTLFRQMSLVQRVFSAAVLIAVLVVFGNLLIWNPSGQYLPIASGKTFTSEELAEAEKAFTSAGLKSYRLDGQRLLAPAQELSNYNAALVESSTQSVDLGVQMLKQFETLGPFSTERQRQQMKEALLLQELRQTIKAVPDIEDARVAIAASERRLAWNEKPRTTATVSIKLRRDRDLSPTLVNSLRQVVANMVPDLRPTDVTIFDVTRGQAYSGDPAHEPLEARYLQRARDYARQYERQIEKALAHIPNLGVHVNIDLETLKSETNRSSTAQSRKLMQAAAGDSEMEDDAQSHLTGFRGSNDGVREMNREEMFFAALPQSIQVSVSIPRDYLRSLVAHRSARREKSLDRLNPELIEDEVLAKVEQIVRRLIPADSMNDPITVTFIDPVSSKPAATTPLLPYSDLEPFAHQWGGLIAIALMSLMLITVLWRARATEAHFDVETPDSVTDFDIEPAVPESPAVAQTPPQETMIDRTVFLREEIRSLVKSDPTATASILNRWLTEVAT